MRFSPRFIESPNKYKMLVDKKSFINLSVEEFVRTFVKLKKNMHDFMLSLILIFMVQHSILNGDERHNQFSNQEDDELTGEIFAIFDRQDYSRVRCGILCLDDQCCEEFLYSASTRRCIGRHFMWFSSSSSDNAVYTTYEGMTSYKKGSYSHCIPMRKSRQGIWYQLVRTINPLSTLENFKTYYTNSNSCVFMLCKISN